MADESTRPDQPVPVPERSTTVPDDQGASRRVRRPVYEPTLLPPRTRRRASPWLVIPGLLVALGVILYVVLVLPRQRRFVATAGQVAYASDAGTPGHPHIWVAGPDGSRPRRLTSSTGDETSPAWSADGSQITYLSDVPDSGSAEPQAFVADADGRDARQVTHNAGAKTQPQFAPSDADLLGYLSGGAFSTADVPTGETVRLLPSASETSRSQSTDAAGAASQPPTITGFAWSPSKDRAQQGLAAVEDAGGVQALVLLPTLSDKPHDARDDGTPLAAADTLTLGWSPDGALLAVALQGVPGPTAGRTVSALVLYDGQGNTALPRPLAFYQAAGVGPQHPVFSPDGALLVWEVWAGADLAHQRGMGLYAAPVDGAAPPRPIYQGPAEDARFARDGRSLYFLQARPDGTRGLCRIGADGSGFQRLSGAGADVTSVVVSPQTGASR